MHIPEMELTGEESLPRCTHDVPKSSHLTATTSSAEILSPTLRQVVIRIDNQEYGLDYATFLHHFKAREIETIKVCQERRSDEGMQQSGRKSSTSHCAKKENGTTGRWGLFG